MQKDFFVGCNGHPTPVKYRGGNVPGSGTDEDSRTDLGRPVLRRDRGGPLSFEGRARESAPRPDSFRSPGYGREPVGNGQAAAGFSAVLAPVTAADAGAMGDLIGAAWLAAGLAGFFAFFFFFAAGFFLAAFFFFFPAAFFLAVFFAAFLFFEAFFLDAFFFFFFAGFLDFFLALAMVFPF